MVKDMLYSAHGMKFLIDNIKKPRTPKKAKSYDEFIRQNNSFDEGAYNDAVNSAFINGTRSASDYGTQSQRLGASGLGSSGYAAYLKEKSKDNFANTLNSLNLKKAENEAGLGRSYSRYLDEYAKGQENLKGQIKKTLLDNRVLDSNAAYVYALNCGLSEEDATSLAQDVYTAVRPGVLSSVITKIVEMQLDTESARLYARRMGLGKNDVNFAIESASKIRANSRKYYEQIFDYLNSLEEQSKKILG